MRKVIAFCGFEQSGKSYSASRLKMTMNYEIISFADPLRDVAFSTMSIDPIEGMKHYEKLKRTILFGNSTFRNVLENLGSAIRKYDNDFWVKAALKKISSSVKNIAISDLRYKNEYMLLKSYCEANNMDFKLVFCDYHSEKYNPNNYHESTNLARYLKEIGYNDQQYVADGDMKAYGGK